MSEKLIHNSENNHEYQPGKEIHEPETLKQEKSTENHVSKKEHLASVESRAKKVEKHSTSSDELERSFHETRGEKTKEPQYVTPSLKGQAKKQALKNIRRELSPAGRIFSKAIHQPIVDAVSETAGKTIARPTGLLSGGMFSLISSIAVFGAAKYYGYEYNFFIGIISFIGGFITGLLIEGLVRLASRSKY